MSFLKLLPTLLPILMPTLKTVVGNSGHKQLVDMLDNNMPAIQSLLGFVSENVELKNNNDKIIELLLNKIPDSNLTNVSNNDRIKKLEIEVENMKDLLVQLNKKVK